VTSVNPRTPKVPGTPHEVLDAPERCPRTPEVRGHLGIRWDDRGSQSLRSMFDDVEAEVVDEFSKH
jgi:hypothetical protein